MDIQRLIQDTGGITLWLDTSLGVLDVLMDSTRMEGRINAQTVRAAATASDTMLRLALCVESAHSNPQEGERAVTLVLQDIIKIRQVNPHANQFPSGITKIKQGNRHIKLVPLEIIKMRQVNQHANLLPSDITKIKQDNRHINLVP